MLINKMMERNNVVQNEQGCVEEPDLGQTSESEIAWKKCSLRLYPDSFAALFFTAFYTALCPKACLRMLE